MDKKDTVDYFIKSTWHAINRMYNQKAQRFGISTSLAFVLLNIHTEFGTRATKIAPLIGLESTSLARMLKTMEQDGLIERQPDPEDGRAVRIFLTKSGLEKKKIAMDTVMEFNNQVRKVMTEEEFKCFVSVFNKINNVLDNIIL